LRIGNPSEDCGTWSILKATKNVPLKSNSSEVGFAFGSNDPAHRRIATTSGFCDFSPTGFEIDQEVELFVSTRLHEAEAIRGSAMKSEVEAPQVSPRSPEFP
jgi:hypothetical protein